MKRTAYELMVAPVVSVIFLSSFCLSVRADEEEESSTRIKRPSSALSCEESRADCNLADNSTFRNMNSGIAKRWWRNFRNPTFCSYVLCAGSCANVTGIPKIGNFSADDKNSEDTPCAIGQAGGDCSNGGACSPMQDGSKCENPSSNSDCCVQKSH